MSATAAASLPAALAAILMVAGAALTLIGSIGLVKFRTFYERVHAPTLGMTLGTICIAAASMIYFTGQESRPILHEILIIVFVVVTTPVTLMVLVRAAQLRERLELRGSSPG